MTVWLQLNRIISIVAAVLGIYALVVTCISIPEVYSTSRSFFEGESLFYPISMTAMVALAPFACFGIALLSYFNKKSYSVFVYLVYVYFVFFSYLIYMLAGLLIWWFFFDKRNIPPNNKINPDAA